MEDNQIMMLVGIRTDDLREPYVESAELACSMCGSGVWIDAVTAAQHPDAKALCTVCVVEMKPSE